MSSAAPLSQSQLYTALDVFFEKAGMKVWDREMIPSFVTSNAFSAAQLASVLAGYVHDSKSTGLVVLDVGSGSGVLGTLLLRRLLSRADLRHVRAEIRVILTDTSRKVVEAWRKNEKWVDLVDGGWLKFQVLDAHLPPSHPQWAAIRSAATGHPIALLGSYLLDTLRTDAFRVRAGACRELLVKPEVEFCVEKGRGGEAGGGEEKGDEEWERVGRWVERVWVEWEEGDVDVGGDGGEKLYNVGKRSMCEVEGEVDGGLVEEECEVLNGMVDWYLNKFKDLDETATFTLPIGGVRLLLALQPSISIFLDKGVVDPALFIAQPPPELARHGSFSVTVNLHSLTLFAAEFHQSCFLQPEPDLEIRAAILTPLPDPPSASSFLQAAVDDMFEFSLDGFHILTNPSPDLDPFRVAMSRCRLARWDVEVVASVRDTLEEGVQGVDSPTKAAMVDGVVRMWKARAEHDPSRRDVSFMAGKLLLAADHPDLAIQCLEASWDEAGSHLLTAKLLHQAAIQCRDEAKTQLWEEHLRILHSSEDDDDDDGDDDDEEEDEGDAEEGEDDGGGRKP